ncbi:hypothetical protein D3C87_1362100 [compost metagenome]
MPIRYLPRLKSRAVNRAPIMAGFHFSVTSGKTLNMMVNTAVTAARVMALFKMLISSVVVSLASGMYSLILLEEIK